MEVVSLHVGAVHRFVELVQFLWFTKRHQRQQIIEMIKYDNLSVEDIEHIGCIVLCLCLILYGDILEIAHSVKRGITIESTEFSLISTYLDAVY